jgi:hypothetical protein
MSDEIKISVVLPKGTDEIEGQNALYKASNHHVSGDVHDEQAFDDPAMADLQERLVKEHQDMYKLMLAEIFKALESDYK